MHALADTGVPNRICPQKESLASTVDCPTGPNPVDFLLFFPTMPCFTKVKNGQKQWGCREWMAVPIFPVPAIRKPWLPPSAAYRKLVYRFFPSFPSQNASLAWLGFALLLCSVLWALLIWLFKVFCKWAELYLSLPLSLLCGTTDPGPSNSSTAWDVHRWGTKQYVVRIGDAFDECFSSVCLEFSLKKQTEYNWIGDDKKKNILKDSI